jgi:hypothetical protein
MNFDSDNIGRPLQPGSIDNQEVQRHYDKEQVNDINNIISQKKNNGDYREINDKDKVTYIKGEVYIVNLENCLLLELSNYFNG